MPTFLYVVRHGDSNIYKIGTANDISQRVAQLQTGNPCQITIHACYEFGNAQYVEMALHEKFAHNRVSGEWFNLNGDNLKEISHICVLLNGIEQSPPKISRDDAEDEEQIQELLFDEHEVRVEKRFARGNLVGFILRERNKNRRVVAYIGKRENPDSFNEFVKKYIQSSEQSTP